MRNIKCQELTELVASGERCPCSGEWEMLGWGRSTCIMREGEAMPLYVGIVVLWRLIHLG